MKNAAEAGIQRGGPHEATYLTFIDGLRCLAVTLVVIFHVLPAWLPGGYVGVDVFFVISGFLITGICLKPGFSYLQFLRGRCRRIVPAYFAVLLLSGLLACAILLPDDLRNAAKSLAASPWFLQNFVFWKQINYFSPALERNPFLHTWSLAVEWQFYLVFPFLLRPLMRTRWLLPALVLLFLGSLAVSTYGAITRPTPTFYLTPFRAWEFLVGGFISLGVGRIRLGRGTASALTWIGLLAIMASGALFSSQTLFPGASALLPCLGTAAALIGGIAVADSLPARLLSLPPVRLIGQASYSIYLMHWPLLVFVRYFELDAEPRWVSAAILLGAVLLGLASWRYIERPFRTPATGRRRALLGWATAGAIAATAVLAIGLQGLPQRFSNDVLRVQVAARDHGNFRACLGHAIPTRLTDVRCHLGVPGADDDVVLWGDSFAAALATGLDELAGANGVGGSYVGTDACPPLQGYLGRFRAALARCQALQEQMPRLLSQQPPQVLILHATWYAYYRHAPALFADTVRDSFARYRPLASRVVVVGAPPEARGSVPDRLARQLAFGLRETSSSTPEALRGTAEANRIIREAALANGFTYVDLMPSFCQDQCRLVRGGMPLFFDQVHITGQTARALAQQHQAAFLPTTAPLPPGVAAAGLEPASTVPAP